MDKLQEKLKDVPLTKIATLTAVGAAAGSCVWYLYHVTSHKLKQSRAKNPLPPGPLPLPLIGSLHKVVKHFGPDGNPRIHRGLMDLSEYYGPIYGLFMGAYYTVVISDPALAHEAFVTNGKYTSDRAYLQSSGGDHVPSMYIFTRNGKGIAMSTGRYWRFVRTRLQENISRPKPAAAAAPVILNEVQSVISLFRSMSERGENITNLTMQLKRESMNVAMEMIFSTRFGTKDAESNPDFLFMQYAVEYFFKNLSSGNPGDMIPIFRIFPTPMLWEMQRVVNQRDKVLGGLIGRHKEEFMELKAQGKMEKEGDARDLLDLFFLDELRTAQEADPQMRMTADKIHVSVWDMIFAMTDTTASTNEWLIYYMVNHPDVQRRVHAELDSVCRDDSGNTRLPSLEDRERLPYFWATIKEVMRIKTISPVLAPHYCSKEFVMSDGKGGKCVMPRGAQIFVAAFSMANDPKYWVKPEEFNPDRWLNDDVHGNAGLDIHGQETRAKTEHYKFIPFSLGPRTCPGYSFARVSLFLQAAAMMLCFEWGLSDDAASSPFVDGGRLDMTESWGLTIMPRHYGEMGLIKATPRPASNLAKAQPGDETVA